MTEKKNKMTQEKKVTGVSRRDLIKVAGAGVVAVGFGAGIIIPGRVRAEEPPLPGQRNSRTN